MIKGWHCVGHVCELANPGDYLVLPVSEDGGEIAVMNYEGYLHAFNNRCPHRGARIFTELFGNRPPICGYHGRCAKPATIEPMPWRIAGNFVFVAAGPGLVQPFGFGDDMMDFIDRAPGAMRLHSRLQFVMDCDWSVAVENALDLEHVPHVHADSLARLGLKRERLLTYVDGSSIEFMESTQVQRLDKIEPMFAAAAIDFVPFNRSCDYVHAHFFPYAAVSSTRGFTYSLQNYFPTADGRTWFMHRLYASPAPRALESYFEGVEEMNTQVFCEDAVICKGIPPWPQFVGKLGPSDDRIAAFREAIEVRGLF